MCAFLSFASISLRKLIFITNHLVIAKLVLANSEHLYKMPHKDLHCSLVPNKDFQRNEYKFIRKV